MLLTNTLKTLGIATKLLEIEGKNYNKKIFVDRQMR